MRKMLKIWCFFTLLIGSLCFLSSFLVNPAPVSRYKFPYKQAGLTERQAAEHLLSRFSYGATPGQVDSVIKMGLENWFNQQLAADLPDDSLNKRLSSYDAIKLSNTEVCRLYPPGFVIRSLAIKDSVINKDSVNNAVDKKAFNKQLQAYMDEKGFKSDQELYKQFISQKILRATYTRNQLQEVMTDFWFNHFNVSFFKGECAQFIPAYERDVIRPNVLGKFGQLLLTSAKSPAMLYYLDNFTSVGPTAKASPKSVAKPVAANGSDMMMMAGNTNTTVAPNNVKTLTKPTNLNGLNENYAREVMELHTLGVDGGYTQNDVTQAARILTGWTVYAISDNAYGSAMKGLVARVGENNLAQKGYVREGDFLFTPNRHDNGEKVVLAHHFPATTDPGVAYQEGIKLLDMLAHQPATAKFISRKLAVRFVNDAPVQSLINKMAKSFTDHDGDVKQVLITMVASKEFWDKKTMFSKTKSPFELAISSVRGLNADIKDPYPLFSWISRMGQKIYYYQAPTGFPDRGKYWINTGSLLNRMDFSLALASGQISGIKVNLNKITPQQKTQENAQAIISTYSKLLLPEKKLDQTNQKLAELLNDPGLLVKANNIVRQEKNGAASVVEKSEAGAPGDMMLMGIIPDTKSKNVATEEVQKRNSDMFRNKRGAMQALAAGIIIGSPEFQQR
jgi:uncharacterized protein (DUF1800 family)